MFITVKYGGRFSFLRDLQIWLQLLKFKARIIGINHF